MTSESEEVSNMHEEYRGDDSLISPGWSITVGELRKAIAYIPDDYEVMLDNAEVSECEISNININDLYPPSLDAPGLLILGGGQIVTSEYAYHQRMDAHHIIGGNKYWTLEKGWHD